MTPNRLYLLLVPFIFGVAYLLFFHHLGERDLWSSHEARAAQNAETIRESGRWGLPRLFDGRVEMQKPPLYYWLVAAIATLKGGPVDAWAVRLPAAFAALGGVVGVYLLMWLRGRPLAGLLAAAMLATMLHYTWLARVGRIDMPLTCAVTAALGCFYLAYTRPSRAEKHKTGAWLLPGYMAVAAAILLKGPIGLVLPAVVVLAYLPVEYTSASGWKSLVNVLPTAFRSLRARWGLALILVLTLPWFIWANRETNGQFFQEFFYRHNFQRGLGGDEALEAHPWWFYGPRVAVDLFPWSLLLPAAGFLLFRPRYWQADAEARFGAVWFAAIFLFLSAMSFKRADYLLPAYPGAALLLGCVAEQWIKTCLSPTSRRRACAGVAGVVACCCIGWVVYVDAILPRLEPAREFRRFAEEVRQRVPQPGLVLLFRTEPHALMYHLGRPLDRIVEWENLDIWACQPMPMYVIMPPECAAEWPQRLEAGRLYPVLSNSDLAGVPHEQPLVLLCTRP